MQTLVTGVSGYVGAALAERLRSDGHAVRGFARSRERVTAAGVELDDLVLGDVTTGAGLERALDGVDVAYYLIHSMEGAVAGAFADTELRSAGAFARRGRCDRPAPRRLPRRARPGRRAAVAPPRLAAGGRGRAARRGAGGDRAARVDRDRRALALVPLPRAPDRAGAGAGAAGLARQPHGADRRARRARVPRPRRDRPSRARRAQLGHRRPGRDDLCRDDRPHLGRADGPPALRRRRRLAHAGRVRSSRRRSPARTRR